MAQSQCQDLPNEPGSPSCEVEFSLTQWGTEQFPPGWVLRMAGTLPLQWPLVSLLRRLTHTLTLVLTLEPEPVIEA